MKRQNATTMEPIHIKPSETTPEITLDAKNGIFVIAGKCHPENVESYFKPVIMWLDEYIKKPNEKTQFEFIFKYFNTASSRMILVILDKLLKIHRQGYSVLIRWHYLEEDEDLFDEGNYFANITKLPFEFKTIEDSSDAL